MNKSLWLSALLLLALSSCLKNNDDEEQVYYHDTALTSFKLGTLKRILHTTSSSGEDSTYSSTVLGAAYAFTIDQQKGLVYNVDSLPVGTDVSKVIFTASTKNSGSLVLNLRTKDGQRDSLKVYSTTDSIDFTNPVEFRVYNQSGTTYRKYMVEVRAHKQNGNIFRWKQVTLTADEKAALLAQRTQPTDVSSVIGGDALDTAAEWLPTSDLNLVSMPLKTNADALRKVLVGNRNVETHPSDTTAMVWCKIVDPDALNQPWFFYTPASSNRYQLPRMKNLQVAVYGDWLVAIGGAGLGACTQQPYKHFYVSEDNGLTWHRSASIVFPSGFTAEGTYALVADNDKNLWLIDEASGTAWCGYLNKMKWEEK